MNCNPSPAFSQVPDAHKGPLERIFPSTSTEAVESKATALKGRLCASTDYSGRFTKSNEGRKEVAPRPVSGAPTTGPNGLLSVMVLIQESKVGADSSLLALSGGENGPVDQSREALTPEKWRDELNDKMGKLSYRRRNSLKMARYLHSVGVEERASKLDNCGSRVMLRNYYTVGKTRLKSGQFCQQIRICHSCAAFRAAKQARHYWERAVTVLEANPNLRPVMFTLTAPTVDDLPEGVKKLKSALSHLIAHGRKTRRGQRGYNSEWAAMVGGVASIEITRSKGKWHPHIHGIALLDRKINKAKWTREFGSQIGIAEPNTDLRLMSGARGSQLNLDQLRGDFIEVFKYSLKLSELEPSETWEAYQAIKGKRLLSSWGNMRGVKVPEDLTEDLLEDLPYVDLLLLMGKTDHAYSCVEIRRSRSFVAGNVAEQYSRPDTSDSG